MKCTQFISLSPKNNCFSILRKVLSVLQFCNFYLFSHPYAVAVLGEFFISTDLKAHIYHCFFKPASISTLCVWVLTHSCCCIVSCQVGRSQQGQAALEQLANVLGRLWSVPPTVSSVQAWLKCVI